MFGVQLVLAEQRKTGFEKSFQVGVLRVRNQQILKRIVDVLVESDIVFDVSDL